jgi:D-sedoheptulose 7-phosphate isomerase
MSDLIQAALAGAADALDQLRADPASVDACARLAGALVACCRARHKVLICGNGGSSCDAAHFAEELTGRFRKDRPPLAAIACTDAGHITCTANDYGFEEVFARWVTALGRHGDVLILLSTSGDSQNMVRAAAAGAAAGLTTASLLGKGGGRLKGSCAIEVLVPGETSDRIQELHMLILHTMVEAVEKALFGH